MLQEPALHEPIAQEDTTPPNRRVTTPDALERGQRMAAQWLNALNTALESGDFEAAADLFLPDGELRDMVALSSNLLTVTGREQIAELLRESASAVHPRRLSLASGFAPSPTYRNGEDVVEALVQFQTDRGPGQGVVRLVDGEDGALARTLLTGLAQLDGFEERVGPRRPSGKRFSRTFGGPNWADLRAASATYTDREPEVLVVGAGQAGLSMGARLHAMGIDALLVDPHETVGDNWHKRYHSLTLHNEIWVNHMPFMPFPDTWPMYTPKDMLGNWFEAYAAAMELNVWTRTALVGGSFDEDAGRWSVELATPDGARTVRPRHVVMAIGLSGVPHLPDIPGLSDFEGDATHSGTFNNAEDYAGKSCIVFGTGTSGHDAAQELYSAGAARVVLVQRQPTTVISIDPSSRYAYAVYEEGHSTEQADLLVMASGSYATTVRGLRSLTAELRAMDADLIEKLEAAGFRTDYGADGTGHQMKQLQKGGGFYINVGASDLIIDGSIELLPHADFDRILPHALALRNGSTIPADLIVLATGYKTLQSSIASFFGDEVAEAVGPVWGFGDDGELRNMWRRTGQRNLWFTGGSFSQCRMYSKVLAQQIAIGGVTQDTDPYGHR